MYSKRAISTLVFTIFSLILLSCSDQNQVGSSALRHVVLIKFKEGTTPQQIKSVEDAFSALPSAIKEVKDFEWGTNISPENKAQGYTHCFLVTFANEKDRDVYLPHPAHNKFVEILVPYLDQVLVVDYLSKK
jgi:hypothetical protein